MKPHPRILKTIKWAGTAVTVLLVVVWIGSGWWTFGILKPKPSRLSLNILGGAIVVMSDEVSAVPWWNKSFDRQSNAIYWPWRGFGHLEHTSPTYWYLIVPLWIPSVAGAVATSIAWRLDTLARRRERARHCPKCRYDRTGLPTGAVCPECGTGASAQARSA